MINFTFQAFLDLADLSLYSKVNLYNYTSTDGRSLQKAIDFIIPYATGEKTWPFKQIVPFEWLSFFEVFRRATYAYGGEKYENAITKIGALPIDDVNRLIYPNAQNGDALQEWWEPQPALRTLFIWKAVH